MTIRFGPQGGLRLSHGSLPRATPKVVAIPKVGGLHHLRPQAA
jgi:hypothetical protein